jgi:hypothetical protein
MVGVPARREQVAYAQRRGLSQRRSCTLLGVARSALGYRSVRAAKDGPGRCATWGLRAPARCNIVLDGTIEEAGDASSLQLAWSEESGQVT